MAQNLNNADFRPSSQKKVLTGKLREDIQVLAGAPDVHGEPTWMLFDPVSDKYFQMGPTDHAIISRLNRNRPVDALVGQLARSGVHLDEAAILTRLNFLNHGNLMEPVVGKTEQRLALAREARTRSAAARLMSSYLFFKIPLWQPDHFLSKTYAFMSACFNPWTLLALSLTAAAGYVQLIVHWPQFMDAMMRSLTFQGLFKYAIVIILLKIGHEFAHAYTAKWAGVRVRRFGIGFIVFFPRLYTDITDAWRIKRRRIRMLIDGAGILSEILIGGLAVFVWLKTAPGTVHTLCFYMFAVSVVNTVFINGNPFIRYDGYYLLMDWSGIDNLRQRGSEAMRAFLHRCLLGLSLNTHTAIKGWKAVFLFCYGLGSIVYRFFLYTAIILIVYFKFTKGVGLFLIGVEIYLLIGRPLAAEGRVIWRHKKMIRKANLIGFIAVLMVLTVLCTAPLPWPASLPCEVKARDSQILYVRQEGFLTQLYVKEGDRVKRDQLLFTQSNPIFELEGERLRLKVKQLRAELDQVQNSARTIALKKASLERLDAAMNSYKEFQRRTALFENRARFDGVFTLNDPLLKPGKWLSRGYSVGEVFAPRQTRLFAYVKEKHIMDVKPKTKATITLQNELDSISGQVVSINLAPVNTLPPNALLDVYGGPLPTLGNKQGAFKLAEPYYRVTIANPSDVNLPVGRTGTARVYVFSSLLGGYLRTVLQVIQKELSF